MCYVCFEGVCEPVFGLQTRKLLARLIVCHTCEAQPHEVIDISMLAQYQCCNSRQQQCAAALSNVYTYARCAEGHHDYTAFTHIESYPSGRLLMKSCACAYLAASIIAWSWSAGSSASPTPNKMLSRTEPEKSVGSCHTSHLSSKHPLQ